MALRDVTAAIISEAKERAEALHREAEQEAERIRAAAEQEAASYERELCAKAEQLVAAARRKTLAAAEFEGRRMLLDARKALIGRAVEEAQRQLEHLPAAERREFLAELLAHAAQEIDIRRVLVSARDRAAAKDALKEVQKAGAGSASAAAKKSRPVAIREHAIAGGVVAENADGSVSVNLSIEELLAQLREAELQQLGEVLFHA